MKNLRMKSARAALDMSQQQLADAVGVTRQTINAIEKGDYNPTIRLCLAICRALGKTLDELQNDESFIAWSRDSMHNAPPEGEDGVAFIRRVIHGLDDVFQDMMANELHSAALVIPGGMIMSMLALMGFPRHPMGEWECDAGAGYTIVMTPELWTRDKVFEVLSRIPMSPEDWEDHWSTKKYYEDGEEMFFE